MTEQLLVLAVDCDVCGHIAVGLRRHCDSLRKNGLAVPDAVEQFAELALQVASSSQQQSASDTDLTGVDDGLHDREYLSRSDVHRITGASLRTVDRWIADGGLTSIRHGRTRRVARANLDAFLKAA
jgi:excisionase family DNA binding protein